MPKNILHSGGLNPEPLDHESSALTNRPVFLNRRVAKKLKEHYSLLN